MSSKLIVKQDPILFCFCAPTAAGKTTITKELVKRDEKLLLSLSTTTRKPRPTEVEGKDYFFVSPEVFQEKVQRGEFLEHATFSGNSYGTTNENIDRARASGADLILDIDVQGVEQIRVLFPKQLVVVFVFPPSFAVLKARLEARGTEDEEKRSQRLAAARKEISLLSTPGFADYLLINDEIEAAIKKAQEIVEVERLRCHRLEYSKLVAFE